MNLPIEKCLTISTLHMVGEDPPFGDVRFEAHEYGFVVFVTDMNPEMLMPVWLNKAYKLALKNGCTLINFDSAADVVDSLPQWEW